ncbi:MAG: hypothetical protein JO010_10870, partial [Alphaproteobacteria bacterium]|nr:hypothetical protein [Alphaproteobacteria bacterium]
ICDWTDFDAEQGALVEALDWSVSSILPFILLATADDPALHLRCAKSFVGAGSGFARLTPLWDATLYRHPRMRIGYLSADLRNHAVAHLIAGLFEGHDRERFEIHAFSWANDDASEIRRRLERSFEHFHDVRHASDREVAQRMRALEIDIAVDLTGFTENGRHAILAHRPAPIQVNYLGYPGTIGADFIDYIIVDPFVVAADQQQFFAEKLVHLPECYQANDRARPIAADGVTRAECGLPEKGFVFACFNNPYKLTPPVFDVWMRLLRAVPGAVLWLLQDNDWARANLCREAERRGVCAGRLVFAPILPPAEHLARQRLADLFLDTLPYNAHTTASDALWVGLPVLTCVGRSFAARVAGSLLHAIGLPELVTSTLEDYEALALELARRPDLLNGLRDRLRQNRLTLPLFDTDRFCRHIEDAYRRMWEMWQSGEPPRAFAVPPRP